MKIRSAFERTSATLGAGSNVWELVPSGTTPSMSARSPATLAAMLVMGATVVTTLSLAVFAPAVDVSPRSSPPHAPAASIRRKAAATARFGLKGGMAGTVDPLTH